MCDVVGFSECFDEFLCGVFPIAGEVLDYELAVLCCWERVEIVNIGSFGAYCSDYRRVRFEEEYSCDGKTDTCWRNVSFSTVAYLRLK